MTVMLDIILITVLAICLYTDIRQQKIYNAVLLPALILALTINFYLGGADGLLESGKGLLLGLALLIIPFALGGMGAGDVKLLGVIGAFKGPEFVWLAFLATALIGGLIALILIIKNGQLKQYLQTLWLMLSLLFSGMPKANMLGTINNPTCSNCIFPYGIAITAGTVVAYFLK